MIYGDASKWLPDLQRISEIILHNLLPEAWPSCLLECPSVPPREHVVNGILVKHLREQKRKKKKQFDHIKFWIHECTVNSGTDKQGKPDIYVQPMSSDGEEEIYLAYECKWIGSPKEFRKTEYTGANGMERYLNGKYAPHVPKGNMIGYVIGGDLNDAEKRIKGVLKEKGFIISNSPEQPIGLCHVGNTKHLRPNETETFIIEHILLPYH